MIIQQKKDEQLEDSKLPLLLSSPSLSSLQTTQSTQFSTATISDESHDDGETPSFLIACIVAVLFVLSGVAQPLLMTVVKDAGLADPTCQLYMLFYYLGPALASLNLLASRETSIPKLSTLVRTGCVASFDIVGQTMNYTGAAIAGPTVFAIIYSSVTVWTAVFSTVILRRHMNNNQWLGVATVFGGLAITAFNSVSLGPQVFHGAIMITIGSAAHSLTYVYSEAIMTNGDDSISYKMYCAVYGSVACFFYLIWQLVYTRPNFSNLILQPMHEAHTTILGALGILLAVALVSLVHSLGFFHTVKHFPMGATSAGIMKGLQAVLVFLFTSLIYCGRSGGSEMCFSRMKFVSLIVVVTGVILYGKSTEKRIEEGSKGSVSGYSRIGDHDGKQSSIDIDV